MSLQVSIVNGKVFKVTAEEDWSVRSLKVSIENQTGHHPSRQRLVSSKGAQLVDEEQLSRYTGVEQLSLVVLPRTKLELKRLKRRAAAMPQWLQRALEETLDSAEAELNFKNDQAVGTKKLCMASSGMEHMERSTEVIAAIQGGPLRLVQVGNDIEFQFACQEARRATFDVVLEAVECAPALVLPFADFELALKIVQTLPNTFAHLPEKIQKSTCILDAALRCDDVLRADFLQSAGKREIREWQWRMEDEARPLRKRRAAKNIL